jgi:Fur family ferric uptake transcriptional regulator
MEQREPSPEFIRFKKRLKQNGHFVTMPRMRLFAILQDNPALLISELITKLNTHDQATVYRNIKLFEELGIVNRLQLGWESKLELSDRFEHHHHHMTCLRCGKVLVLQENIAIEKEIARIGTGTNFTITDHQLEIRGYCSVCSPGGSQLGS